MIIQGYHPLLGGAERQLRSVAPLLLQRGIDVQVLTRRHTGTAPYELVDGVPVHRLPVPGPRPAKSLAYTAGSLALLRKLRPAVIHAYELSSASTTAIAAKRWLGVPVVVKLLRGGVRGDIDRLGEKIFGRRRLATFVREVDAFMTISREIDAELARAGVAPERRPFIPNGVDTRRFAPATPDERARLRAEHGLSDGQVAVFVGRLAPEKRVDLLLRAWSAASKPDATLLVLGEGPEEQALRALAGPNVRFMGRVEDTAPFLKAADLFVLPSSTEGLSNALLEALAAGLPALATDVGGASDVVQHGVSGWLIPPDDPRALGAGLRALLVDASLREQLGRAGCENVRRGYSLDSVADQLAALYVQLASRRAGAGAMLRKEQL